MRTVCLAFVPILFAVAGYLFSLKYNDSREFWDKFMFWHKKIKTEIAFSQNTLSEILHGDEKSDMFLSAAINYIYDKKSITKLKFLSEEENNFLKKYLENLGTTDKNSQLNLLNSMEQELSGFVQISQNKSKKYRPLYIKLGFLFGLIVFILVV